MDINKRFDRYGSFIKNVISVILPFYTYQGTSSERINERKISDESPEVRQDVIDEGRRHFDRQLDSLDKLRLRAQAAFTAAIVFLGFMGAKFSAVSHRDLTLNHNKWLLWAVYYVALVCLTIGLAGSASPILARVPFDSLSIKKILTSEIGSRIYLSCHYLNNSEKLESMVLMLLWTLRYAIRFLIFGTVFGCITLAVIYA
jgi:hypothetical protein